ncbi:MAG: cytochrome c oxidase subunit II [Caldilineales bacterium]|nr:cytochrome c oxidase subunit II [Caldilineales bacterium]
MHIHRYERAWLYASLALVGIFFLAIFVAAVAGSIQLPSPQGEVNPNDLSGTDFAKPGVRELSPGNYEAYLVGQAWTWTPNEIRIPEGSNLKIYLTSGDVQHGFKVLGTIMNVMVIPGQVSLVEHEFDRPGEYLWVCHEFCGLNHQNMSGKIIVEPVNETTAALAGEEEQS